MPGPEKAVVAERKRGRGEAERRHLEDWSWRVEVGEEEEDEEDIELEMDLGWGYWDWDRNVSVADVTGGNEVHYSSGRRMWNVGPHSCFLGMPCPRRINNSNKAVIIII